MSNKQPRADLLVGVLRFGVRLELAALGLYLLHLPLDICSGGEEGGREGGGAHIQARARLSSTQNKVVSPSITLPDRLPSCVVAIGAAMACSLPLLCLQHGHTT